MGASVEKTINVKTYANADGKLKVVDVTADSSAAYVFGTDTTITATIEGTSYRDDRWVGVEWELNGTPVTALDNEITLYEPQSGKTISQIDAGKKTSTTGNTASSKFKTYVKTSDGVLSNGKYQYKLSVKLHNASITSNSVDINIKDVKVYEDGNGATAVSGTSANVSSDPKATLALKSAGRITFKENSDTAISALGVGDKETLKPVFTFDETTLSDEWDGVKVVYENDSNHYVKLDDGTKNEVEKTFTVTKAMKDAGKAVFEDELDVYGASGGSGSVDIKVYLLKGASEKELTAGTPLVSATASINSTVSATGALSMQSVKVTSAGKTTEIADNNGAVGTGATVYAGDTLTLNATAKTASNNIKSMKLEVKYAEDTSATGKCIFGDLANYTTFEETVTSKVTNSKAEFEIPNLPLINHGPQALTYKLYGYLDSSASGSSLTESTLVTTSDITVDSAIKNGTAGESNTFKVNVNKKGAATTNEAVSLQAGETGTINVSMEPNADYRNMDVYAVWPAPSTNFEYTSSDVVKKGNNYMTLATYNTSTKKYTASVDFLAKGTRSASAINVTAKAYLKTSAGSTA